MSNESSSFKRNVNYPANAPKMREFTVGSPNEDMDNIQMPMVENNRHLQSQEDVEQELRNARREKQEAIRNGPKITDSAKKRIEILAGIGRLVKDIKIGEYTFTLRTLKAKEQREAAIATFTNSSSQMEASFEARKQQLARAITHIDGNDIEAVIGDNSLEAIMLFLEEDIEEIVLNKLFSEFVDMKKEIQEKYGIATKKDVEEVSEDLKK